VELGEEAVGLNQGRGKPRWTLRPCTLGRKKLPFVATVFWVWLWLGYAIAQPRPTEAERAATPSAAEGWFLDFGFAVNDYGGLIEAFFPSFGVQGGLVTDFGLRLTLRADTSASVTSDGQRDNGTYAPWLVYAAGVGVVGLRTPNLVIAPSLVVARTSNHRLGTNLLLVYPIDWTLDSGFRLGVDLGLGYNFSGVDYEVYDEYRSPSTSHDLARVLLVGVRSGWGERKGKAPRSPTADRAQAVAVSLDAMLGLVKAGRHWGGWTAGAQLAALLPGSIRLATRFERPSSDTTTELISYDQYTMAPSIVFTGAAGFALIDRSDTTLAPSLAFTATNQPDLGYIISLLVPAMYRTASGFQFGAEGGVGRAFGGSKLVDACTIPGEGGVCGQLVERDVPANWAGSAGMYVGWSLPL